MVKCLPHSRKGPLGSPYKPQSFGAGEVETGGLLELTGRAVWPNIELQVQ